MHLSDARLRRLGRHLAYFERPDTGFGLESARTTDVLNERFQDVDVILRTHFVGKHREMNLHPPTDAFPNFRQTFRTPGA